ncbi:MAG: hypothetical protein GX783_07945 [Clostridiales bacterium]|nr:hypothetical protein [Clostridiales bacterium]
MNKNNNYINNLISKMTLEQKVGSLLTLGFAGTLPRPHIYKYITKYNCGGLRLTPGARNFGNYTDPKTGKSVLDVSSNKGYKKGVQAPSVTATQYKEMLDELQELALSRPLGIPLHFSFDQEGGTSANFDFAGVNVFPKPMGIRATGDSKLAYEIAKAVSAQSRAVGFNWIHSPVLDVNVVANNREVNIRAYSDRVDEVVEYAEQSCIGFKEEGLIATAKHFPGRGDSPVDAHYEVPVITADKETLMKRELLPYIELIKKDLLPSIMIAHSIFPAIDPDYIATVSKKILTGLLRNELGFDGVITTDSMTMGAVAKEYGVANACALSLEAGADLVLMKAEGVLVDETFNTIKQFVLDGRIPEDELDKKVYRVLNTKYEYGLFTQDKVPDNTVDSILNNEKIKYLSKLVAKRSVLVARDRKEVLPLSKEDKILIIEQTEQTPNNYEWHPGMLFYNSTKYNQNIAYLETAYSMDENDIERIRAIVKEFDTIVITNFFTRSQLANNEMVQELCLDPSKKIILVTNTPYEDLSIPKEADTVVITFATTPNNMAVVAGTLFGEIHPEGEWPISLKISK